MKSTEITVTVGKEQLMQSIRSLTIHDENFNPGPWSIWDAEVLEQAAALIRREIAEATRLRDGVAG